MHPTVEVMPDSSSKQLTPKGKLRLEAQHQRLAEELRTVTAEVDEAQNGSGDSEGLMAVDAIHRRSKVQAEYDRVEALLASAEVVEAGVYNRVEVGCVVVLDFGGGELEKYCFGSLHEAEEGIEAVTPESPLGKAIAGASAGDSVPVTLPNGHTFDVAVSSIS